MGLYVCRGMVAAMGNVVVQNATHEDLMRVPEHCVAEIIDGALYSMPRPASPHASASSRLGVLVGGPFDLGSGGPGGWVILDEPELHLGSDVIVPDLAGWRRERMPKVPNVLFFEQSPDWVCEVLSPSTRKVDRSRKVRIYAREGVGHLWFLDPIAHTLDIYRLAGGQWTIVEMFTDDDVVRAEPFEAIELNLALLWRDVQG